MQLPQKFVNFAKWSESSFCKACARCSLLSGRRQGCCPTQTNFPSQNPTQPPLPLALTALHPTPSAVLASAPLGFTPAPLTTCPILVPDPFLLLCHFCAVWLASGALLVASPPPPPPPHPHLSPSSPKTPVKGLQTLLQGLAGRVSSSNPYLAKQAPPHGASILQAYPNRTAAGRADAGKSSSQKRKVYVCRAITKASVPCRVTVPSQ